jgi:hypothetical protein
MIQIIDPVTGQGNGIFVLGYYDGYIRMVDVNGTNPTDLP